MRKPATIPYPSSRAYSSRLLRLLAVATMVLDLLVPVLQTATAYAATVTVNASFTAGSAGNTALVNGTWYARNTGVLTLTANTSPATMCIDVTDASGNVLAHQTSSNQNGQSTWTLQIAAGIGNGTQTVTATATLGFNKNNHQCNMTPGSGPASYVLDNTGPTVTASLAPTPNAAGWNNSNVSITWSATDGTGSGVASGYPTPATDGVTTETAGVTKTSTAKDNVGNTGNGSVTVKLDQTPPTITGSRSPAANANGWNNTGVTVSFTCSDALSGIKSCSGPTTLSSEGANQSVTGTAVDNADNSSSATVSPINIDKTPPTLSGAPTTSPNANGWYNSNVTVAWTCNDALSGIDGSCPANSTISGEGTGLTASASVSDKAGNTTSATSSPAVNIDKTPPVTTASAPPAWNNTDVTVSLNATDALSGVAATYYILDGGAQQTGTSVTITSEGIHTLQFWSVDKAGNTETAHSVQVKIDKTPPTISHTQSPAANANGWNNSNVTVTFTCNDSLSGIASCNGATPPSTTNTYTGSTTVTTEGKNQPVTGTATDNAGNTATDPATVSIDNTPPTVSGAPDRAANANGWYNADVTVTFTCGDALSGIDSCPKKVTLGEGAAQNVSGTALDAAGNSASTTVGPLNIDETPPTLSGAATTTPNANGWYKGDVTVHWTCSDALSGISGNCPADSTITGEGSNLSASTSVSDMAGNTATATVGGIKIDRTPPSTSATTNAPVPGGWNNTDVTVTLSANDNLSGVNAIYYTLDGGAQQAGNTVTIHADGVHTLSYWSVDNAGNVESAHNLQIEIDQSSPTINDTLAPPPNQQGWNNTDVSVTFSCADQPGLSGVASCTPPQTVTTEGAGQMVTGTAVDNAGNSATDPVTVNLDKTPPTISGAPDRAANANGWYNAPVTVAFTCADALSGVASCTAPQTLGEGANQSVTGTAKDNAGNSSSATVSGLNVDETPPLLSGAPTTAPNANGWYNGDVTITWTCSDNLSGIDGTCPGNSTITGEGDNLSASASVSDKAGNSQTATVDGIKIDRTAPSTDVSAPSGWTNNDVTVTLSPHDSLSGVANTFYILDGGPQQTGTTVTITSEGTHSLEFWSVDNAGNTESHKTIQVLIDKTAPTITHSLTPAANANGWNNADVTVTFICADALSGIASCTEPQTVTTEGQNQQVTGKAVDNAGNSATDPATVNLDKTAPTISGAPDRPANANGWYNADVTVSFTCADSLSGIDICADPKTVGEGANQSVTGSATDAAGNSASATVGGINVDETAPTLSGAPTTSPNADGWYNGDVTIHWTCGDALSGIDPSASSPAAPAGLTTGCPADSVIGGEGDNLSANASVSDKAGNSTPATVGGINIDRTPPTTIDDAPSGWNNTSVTVNLSASDNLSGVAATYYTLDGGAQQSGTSVVINTEGVHTLQYWSVDKAGNVEATHTITVKIDTTPPTISHTQSPSPNVNGWNNTDVTVTFNCADALSGVATCTSPQAVKSEGQNQPVQGTATDNAGNSATDLAMVSIDKTPPTISAAADRDPNANGWYNADVTISFTCGDTLSGVATCPAPQTLHEGANQTANGTALDAAGNSASADVKGINVDETPPTLSGAPTTPPNANGWYNGDVAIAWTCSDALSGIDGACPANSTITGEGDNLKASASVSDKAGNQTSATVSGIKIDRTPPTTAASAPSGWQNGDVTVTLASTDNLSGVAATYYTLDGGAQQSGTSVVINTEGVHTLTFWSVDKAGNVEPANTVTVMIDKTAPTITHSQDPAANAAGWNSTNVTVTFICSDALSGIASCTAPQTVSTEGKDQPVIGKAVDNAGNSQTDTATVSIDKTPPTISGAPDRPANANGWYNADVTVSFICADQVDLSGIASCTTPKTLGEGANQSLTGTAVDAAGNSASATVSGINVDKTPPALSGAPTTSPNADGWYNSDVTIAWSCSDPKLADGSAGSGIDGGCPGNTTVTGEGDNLSATASVGDKAGNSTTTTVSGIKIDRTPPTTKATAPMGWQNTDVTVTLSAYDALSGVAATYYTLDGGAQQSGTSVTISAEGVHTLTFWSVDKAGNSEVHRTVTVMIDKTAPAISGAATTSPNANGWYNGPVTVHFTCSDPKLADGNPGSGVASCQPDVTLTGNGANQSVTGTATDNAGNTGKVTVSGINIDTTGPTVTISGVADGAVYILGAVPAPSCAATDALSGVGSCSGSLSGGLPNGVGTFTYTATATDKAGNTTTVTIHYRVIYRWDGFLQPINDTAHQVGTSTSIFKGGSTVPVKFQLKKADGTVVQANTLPLWLTPVQGSSTAAAVNESAYSASSSSGSTYRWDSTGQQYIYNWGTPSSGAGHYWRIGVTLDDGQTYFVNIGLR